MLITFIINVEFDGKMLNINVEFDGWVYISFVMLSHECLMDGAIAV